MTVDSHNQRGDLSLSLDWMGIFYSITTFILYNMLWVFGVLFIVTIPAVTAALFVGIASWMEREFPGQPLKTFAKAIKRYWPKATLIMLMDLLVAGIVFLNLLIIRQMESGQIMFYLTLGVTIFAALLLVLVNVYLWPLLVTVDLPLRDLLKTSLRLSILQPLWGLLIAVLAAIPLALVFFLPGVYRLLLPFSTAAFVLHRGSRRMFRRYMMVEEN